MKEIYLLSLDRALSDIGAAIVDMPYDVEQRDDYVLIWRYSQAAANLHQSFHNVPEGQPKWLMHHPVTRRPVATEEAAARGMALLEELSGWYGRYRHRPDAFRPHRHEQEKLDVDELVKSAYAFKFRSGKLGADNGIGFDRAELIRYLDSPQVDIPHRIHAGQTVEYIEMLAARRRARVTAFTVFGDPKVVTLPLEAPKNEKRIAPRLALPAKADAWAKAIEATYETMALEAGKAPPGLEVWLRMNHKPPDNFPVTVTKDRGLPAIALPGERPLTRDGFNKRWRRYTAAN